MIPVTRKELYLNKIVGDNDYSIPEKPISEEELFFAEILGEAVQAPEPLPRYQMYLAKIAGRDVEIPYPEIRLEFFLARAAGMDIEIPVPITKEEIYWSNYTAIVEFEIENVPPLSYKAIEGTLKNYRIYGNTVNGESVGDRTGNLFDGTFIHRSVIGEVVCDDDPNRRSIVVDVSSYANGNKITFSRETSAGNIFQMYQVDSPLKGGALLNGNVFSGNSETLLATIILNNISNYPYLMIFLNGAKEPIVDETLLASKIMVNVGYAPLPYEPYGYRVPVTVTNGTDTETTNIYLPEQIKMVGDEAEYIDFREQKQYFANGTSVDVTLPALPTLSGTNTLSVGTEVQPSKVYVKGEKEREYI